MTALRDAAHRIARAGPLPMPPVERLLATEKLAARLALGGSAGDRAAWEDRLRRVGILGRSIEDGGTDI